MKLDNIHKDILLAGAIGDAVGYIIEFTRYWRIEKQFGINGLTLDLVDPEAKLIVSDDTQMTLFALEALHINDTQIKDAAIPFEKQHYYDSYLQWFHTQTDTSLITSKLASFKSMQARRAPGNTCLGSLSTPLPHPIPINNSKGCGGIMRAAPFGFIESNVDAFNLGALQAQITHGHPSGYYSAGLFSALLSFLIYFKDVPVETILLWIEGFLDLSNLEGIEELTEIFHLSRNIASNSKGNFVEDIHTIGLGWTGEEAFGIALYSFLMAKSFEDVIKISINHDGDSDSTGLLAAQLYAARYGLPEKYKSWAKRLDIADAYAYVIDETNYR